MSRSLHEIAAEVTANWGDRVNYAAKPYLWAMWQMDKITESYGYDTGDSIVRYFLANATTWRGETARRVKAELKEMLK